MGKKPAQDKDFIKSMLPHFNWVERYFNFRVQGLENVPKKKALVVLNHGIIPFHGFLFAKKIIERFKVYPRALGADFLFQLPLVKEFFSKAGVLPANPRNARKLLGEGELVMLAPGGIYEALIARSDLKRIPWERRMGFVKIAVEMGCPIVPSYCREINRVYANSYFLLKPRIKFFEATRVGIPLFFGLGLLPWPVPLTHRVGKPISTRKRRGEGQKDQIHRIHDEVIQAMEDLADF